MNTGAVRKTEQSSRGTLRFSRRGSRRNILLVSFDRPHVKNAINVDVFEDMIDVLHWSAKDDSISALVLTGTGSYFSSGADLKAFSLKVGPSGRQTLHTPTGRYMMAVIAYPKILAAAVNGPAVGVGVTTLMHCDLVYCSSTATFWTPFTRLALVPEFCSSQTFFESMGLAKANELLLLGKKIDAKTAVEWNVCSRIVHDIDASGDPYHEKSLASYMCQEIDSHLLSLPLGQQSATYFVAMVRGARRKQLQSLCQDELIKLDERFDSGQVPEAARALKIGSKARSKL